jgi:3-phosphoshikimate 1-carboxyvinyltransferase
VVVRANGLSGGTAAVRGDISSQFLSGLLMTAPAARSMVELPIEGPLVSQPYVRLTLAVMRAFGAEVEATDSFDHFHIAAPQRYHPRAYTIEPDASAASYFWAAAAVTGGEVTVDGLSPNSLQGDVAFVDCLEQMGCEVHRDANEIIVAGRPLKAIDVDMNAISDTVQTLAVVALFAEGTTRITNVAHIRHKETDRISALATELRKLGAKVDDSSDGLAIHPPSALTRATIATYNDHRMAMCFSLAALGEAENVACKISGFGMVDHDWTIESIRPWVLHCIEAFGVERSMFGTNWPVDILYSSYLRQIDAYRLILAREGFSSDDQEKLLYRNAEKFYRI